VRVEDAHGQPPTIPFWLGEAPGRSDELSESVSRLRARSPRACRRSSRRGALRWLDGGRLAERAARAAGRISGGRTAALGCLPTRDRIVFERFFDEAAACQLVIPLAYGSRSTGPWGPALRKRFCRKFNFELQAAATEDNIVLSLTRRTASSSPTSQRYLNSRACATADPGAAGCADVHPRGAGSAACRWRCRASRGGSKVPPQLARMQAET
jgi:ATP-dependent Lhr-like helicase